MTPTRALFIVASSALALAGCGEVRPPTPTDVRLSTGRSDHPLPALNPQSPRPARGFLLPAPRWSVEGDSVELRALPDGLTDGLQLRWTAEGGRLEADGPEATLVPEGDWTVVVELRRGARVLAAATAASTPEHTAPRLGLTARTLPLDPQACGDAAFPAQVAAGHVSCSDPSDPSIDQLLPWDATTPTAIPGLPRRSGARDASDVRPHEATAQAGVLAWTGASLGSWNGVDDGTVRWLPGARTLAPPAVGPDHIVVVRDDRIEVARHGSSQRSLVPARPADVAGAVAVAAPWLALLEGDEEPAITLRTIKGASSAVLARPAAGGDLTLDERFLAWADGRRTVWLDLETGRQRSADLGLVRGRRSARLGDWLLVHANAQNGVSVTALHLPTGATQTLMTAADLRLRGADRHRATVARAGEPPELVVLALQEHPEEAP